MSTPIIQSPQDWPKRVKSAKVVGRKDVSPIVEAILEKSPRMAYSKFPLEAMVRTLIWAEVKGISCMGRLAFLLQKVASLALSLGFSSHLHYLNSHQLYDVPYSLLVTPTREALELFNRSLPPKASRLIREVAMDVRDTISKEAVEQ